MFFEPAKRDPALRFDPVKAIIAPRPVGWISTIGKCGTVNLAPYSFFNMFSTQPAIVGFSSEGMKDSPSFAAETGGFVCNLATYDLREAMNETSRPFARGASELDPAGLGTEPSALVAAPRVKGVAAALECRLVEIKQLKDAADSPINFFLVLGEVVGVYIDDRFLRDGMFDTALAAPIARCGYRDYAVVRECFTMPRLSDG